MKTLGITEFKTHCIRVLRDAHRLREPLIVTRRGEPLVRIEPIPGPSGSRRLGALRDQMVIHDDLIRTDFAEEWEVES